MADETTASDVVGDADRRRTSTRDPRARHRQDRPRTAHAVPGRLRRRLDHARAAAPRSTSRELRFGAGAAWELPRASRRRGGATRARPTSARLVASIVRRPAGADPRPRKPWLDELAASTTSRSCRPAHRRRELLLGVTDEPDNQASRPVSSGPTSTATSAVYGTGGSGKSATLRTLAVAAASRRAAARSRLRARLRRARPAHARAAAARGRDHQRRRPRARHPAAAHAPRACSTTAAPRYAAVNAATIVDYRRLPNAPTSRASSCSSTGSPRSGPTTRSPRVARSGTACSRTSRRRSQLGIHVAFTADRPGSVPGRRRSQRAASRRPATRG